MLPHTQSHTEIQSPEPFSVLQTLKVEPIRLGDTDTDYKLITKPLNQNLVLMWNKKSLKSVTLCGSALVQVDENIKISSKIIQSVWIKSLYA